MGHEIDRARTLLDVLTREGVASSDAASSAYERWVARSDETPFSRFLIDEGVVEAEPARAVLRRLAVQGLPHPEKFTLERFEDLLIGQLGIEAGMLSPKLLRTVREVQDKKVGEGKLRRLTDLLPRAGFDKNMLALLQQHLQERVLLCKGCLGRYPRKDLGDLELTCPRCAYAISAISLEPSGVNTLPEHQRVKLMASSEFVLETISVADRQKTRAQREANAPGVQLLAGLAVVLLVVIGVVVAMLSNKKPKQPRVAPRTKTAGTEPGDGGSGSTPGGQPGAGALTATEAEGGEGSLLSKGDFAGAAALWRRVRPAPGEDAAEVRAARQRRLAELERLGEQAKQVAPLLAELKQGSTQEREVALARALRGAPRTTPPFKGALRALRAQRGRRRAAAKPAAQRRFARAEQASSADAWKLRTERARRKRALRGIPLEGRRVDGVRVKQLDAAGFNLLTPKGDQRFEWGTDPALAMRIMAAAAADDSPADQRELLKHALLARNPRVAEAALARLSLENAIKARALVAKAPSSAILARLGKGSWRLQFPTSWVAHDLVPRQGTTLSAEGNPDVARRQGVLVLQGKSCQVDGPRIPARAPARKRPAEVAVSCELEGGANKPYLGLRLVTKKQEWTYLVRWDEKRWTLELDLGSGTPNVIDQGSISSPTESARLAFNGKELVLSLNDRWTTSKIASAGARWTAVGVRVGAAAGPLRVRSIHVEGALTIGGYLEGEQTYAALVNRKVGVLSTPTGRAPSEKFAPLSVEDPQGLALASPASRKTLARAKRALLAGEEIGMTASWLRKLSEQGLAVATYYLAYARLLEHDPGAAVPLLLGLLEDDGGFAEARALLSLALGVARRAEPAREAAKEALTARPDLAFAYLARARAELSGWDLLQPPPPGALSSELAMARSLAPGDPLVESQVNALETTLRALRVLKTRAASPGHIVLSQGKQARAMEVAKGLDKATANFARLLGPPSGKVAVAILSPEDYADWIGEGSARYAPRLGLLILKGAPAKVDRKLAIELAAAHLAHRYGCPPPWLEVGLSEHLATAATSVGPQGYVQLLKDATRYSPSLWRTLFRSGRTTCRNNRQARARSWVFVGWWSSQRQQDMKGALGEAARGVPASLPRGVRLSRLEKQIRAHLAGLR